MLSAVIITKNEEKRLPRCLESLSFVDEVIVVDSGSSDATVEIAKEFGCRVFVEEWKGYGPQKQSAVEKASFKWVLSIDADERVPPETARVILEELKAPRADAYSLRRKNFLHGKWIKGCGWWPDEVVRLFDKSKGRFEGLVHEKWVTSGKVMRLKCHLEHYPFSGYSDMLKKLELYSEIGSELVVKEGVLATPKKALFHGFWTFVKTFIIKQGFKEGFDGFVISLYHALGSFFKYAKAFEKRTKSG